MKRFNNISFLLLIVLALFSCKKDKLEVHRFEITSETMIKGATAAEITVYYTYPEKLERIEGLVSKNADMSGAVSYNAEINDRVFVVIFKDLEGNTKYYYQYEYYNGVDLLKSAVKEFSTNEYGLPIVTTAEVGDMTGTTALCGGNVIDDGGFEVTERGVCWSMSQNPTINNSHTTDGSGTGSFTSNILDLNGSTTYYVRAYAVNSEGIGYGAQKEFTTSGGLPNVMTTDITDITDNSVIIVGKVTYDGNYAVTSRGICWSATHDPTISGSHTNNGSGTGSFTANITGLSSNTTYYVRAYATNEQGTKYGELKSFKTLWNSAGAIDGLFSVSETNQVRFSKGNLQYQEASNSWRFAEHQWDYNNNGWISLFGWATSGYDHGAVCYQPQSNSQNDGDYYAYGSAFSNLNAQTGKADWGYNAISNGGNTVNTWRTLTKEEWVYVFRTRNTQSGIRFAKAKVNGVNGMILLPDNWISGYYSLSGINNENTSFTANVISSSSWANMEAHGAVFLPAAGWRAGDSTHNAGTDGNYWSASAYDEDYSMRVYISNGTFNPDGLGNRNVGFSVRLVSNNKE